jgi:hypothetical protein
VAEPERWTVEHFSQANPEGDGQSDVPALLRRVAGTIDDLGPAFIQDITFSMEIDDAGEDRPTMTVYFHRR